MQSEQYTPQTFEHSPLYATAGFEFDGQSSSNQSNINRNEVWLARAAVEAATKSAEIVQITPQQELLERNRAITRLRYECLHNTFDQTKNGDDKLNQNTLEKAA